MAGRGTDIRLGGADEAERERVVALGGLYVIGTNRHESRRIDLQLRGRAGRQGDPGESRFFVSLEDDLLVRYGIRNLIPARFAPARQDGPIHHPVIRREIARAQRTVEGQNHEIRRTLSRYSEIVEQQRQRLMDRRQALLHGSAAPDVWRDAPRRYRALVEACGAEAVRRAEVALTAVLVVLSGYRSGRRPGRLATPRPASVVDAARFVNATPAPPVQGAVSQSTPAPAPTAAALRAGSRRAGIFSRRGDAEPTARRRPRPPSCRGRPRARQRRVH